MCMWCTRIYDDLSPPRKPCAYWPLVKKARDSGCIHGFGVGPACPDCVKVSVDHMKKEKNLGTGTPT